MPDKKLYPKDIFGNEIVAGDKIVYITDSHGHTVLNWCTVDLIEWPDVPSYRFYHGRRYRIVATKYGEVGGWTSKEKLPMTVRLNGPTALIVGESIGDFPNA